MVKVQLNEMGQIAHARWAELPGRFPQLEMDNFIVMPNHIHGIILVAAQFIAPLVVHGCKIPGDANHRRHTLGEIIRAYKSVSARKIRRLAPEFMWQRNYCDHIIRNEDSLNRIRQYISDNPAPWQFDRENPAAIMQEPDAFIAAAKRAH
jgi:REP-associated tyrosine transposase